MIKTHFSILPILLLHLIAFSNSEFENCVAVYKEGGAPAVFESPKCPRWTLPSAAEMSLPHRQSGCHVSLHQGRRPYQEDRAVCELDIRIPFLERETIKEVKVGIIAIFDGHNGAEASDMASKLILDYLLLHIYFLRDVTSSILQTKSFVRLSGTESDVSYQLLNLDEEILWNNNSKRLGWISPTINEGPFHLEILKESLLRTIGDIDATFSKEALAKNISSGSTASVVIVADQHILAANVGDSKSLICSENYHISKKVGDESNLNNRRRRHNDAILLWSQRKKYHLAKADVPTFSVQELTKDHHPDRYDEKIRVEAYGGYVSEWAGVPRVNGQLAVSRAIGDLPFKKYGVVSTPEVSDWRLLGSNDTFLVVSSDGIFEKLTTEDVCDILLSDAKTGTNMKSTPDSLSDSIIHISYREGTTDNMSVIVIPLKSKSKVIVEDFVSDELTLDLSSVGYEEGTIQNAR